MKIQIANRTGFRKKAKQLLQLSMPFVLFGCCIATQAQAQNEKQHANIENISKMLHGLSAEKIQSLKYMYGRPRNEEAFGEYMESDLIRSKCTYVTQQPALVSDIASSLKQSVIINAALKEDDWWEPREGLIFIFKDGTEMKILFDHVPNQEPILGAINGTPFAMNTGLITKLHQWAIKENRDDLCAHFLARESWK